MGQCPAGEHTPMCHQRCQLPCRPRSTCCPRSKPPRGMPGPAERPRSLETTFRGREHIARLLPTVLRANSVLPRQSSPCRSRLHCAPARRRARDPRTGDAIDVRSADSRTPLKSPGFVFWFRPKSASRCLSTRQYARQLTTARRWIPMSHLQDDRCHLTKCRPLAIPNPSLRPK